MPKICLQIKNTCSSCEAIVGTKEGVMLYNASQGNVEVFCQKCSTVISDLLFEIKKQINEPTENK